MKIKAILTVLFAAFLLTSGCKKEGKLGGNKTIEGIIYYHDGVVPPNTVAPGASVFVTYNSKVATGNVDETLTTDSNGHYSVRGLKKGDYFISAEYTTSSGFQYTTTGHAVTIDTKNKETMNIILY